MTTGTVKFFWKDNYGFIALDDGTREIFVHRSQLAEWEEIGPWDRVEFTIGANEKNGKDEAKNVRKIAA